MVRILAYLTIAGAIIPVVGLASRPVPSGTVTSGTLYRTWNNGEFGSHWSSKRPLFVKCGREFRDCFVSRSGVYGECAGVLVAAFGLEERWWRLLFRRGG